jgi:hypothetical protein
MNERRFSWQSQMPGKPSLDPEYLDSPWLTLAANWCAALGLFLGAWVVVYLIGDLHRGFASYWPLILILIVDVTLNLALRIILVRRRRALGPEASRKPARTPGGAADWR